MKAFSRLLELKTIYNCTINNSAQPILLGQLNIEDFHLAVSKAAFSRILKAIENEKHISWTDLLTDPGLTETNRQILEKYTDKLSKFLSKKEASNSVTRLHEYTKIRKCYALAKTITDTLAESEKLDIDTFIENIVDQVANLDVVGDKEIETITYGESSKEADLLVKDLLENTSLDEVLPTGFAGYDNINRGFAKGNLVILVGPTGGGKTAISLQVARNMAMAGGKIAYVCLEMNNREMGARRLANISNVSLTSINDPKNKLTSEMKRHIMRSHRLHQKELKERGGKEIHIVPKGDLTIREILQWVRPLKVDALIIDYIGLLKDADSEEQWKALGRVARLGKRWAESNNSIVIMNAQGTVYEAIRYSQQIKEHANTLWSWTVNPIVEATNVFEIHQQKSRQQSPHPFFLTRDFSVMMVRDSTQSEIDEYKTMKNGEADGKKINTNSKKKPPQMDLGKAYSAYK